MPIDDTCVLALDFNDNHPDCIDLSKYHNNGTIVGAVKGDGMDGEALSFDGLDDYVDCGNDVSLNITEAITTEAWIKHLGGSYSQRFISKSNTYAFRLINANTVEFFITVEGSYYRFQSTLSSSAVGRFIHLVAIWEENEVARIFENGNELSVTNVNNYTTGKLTTFPQSLAISSFIHSTQFFNGTIDEVRIYNRVISAQEIKDHYELYSR